MVKAILLKPLDGFAEGSEREFDTSDFEVLQRMHAVRAATVVSAPMVVATPVARAPAKAKV